MQWAGTNWKWLSDGYHQQTKGLSLAFNTLVNRITSENIFTSKLKQLHKSCYIRWWFQWYVPQPLLLLFWIFSIILLLLELFFSIIFLLLEFYFYFSIVLFWVPQMMGQILSFNHFRPIYLSIYLSIHIYIYIYI